MKYLIIITIFFGGCQVSSNHIKSNKKENNNQLEKTLNKKKSKDLTFTKFLESIPKAVFPIKYQYFEKYFASNQDQSSYSLGFDKENIVDIKFIYPKNFQFNEIKAAFESKDIPNLKNFNLGPQGGRANTELGAVYPLFYCKNDKFTLVGYLSEWWFRSDGGDFYDPRAQLDIVTYSNNGVLIRDNINNKDGFSFNQLIANIPDFNGHKEVRAEIKSWNTMLVIEKTIQEFEVRLSDNGIDEEFFEYETPKTIINKIIYSISDKGIIKRNSNH